MKRYSDHNTLSVRPTALARLAKYLGSLLFAIVLLILLHPPYGLYAQAEPVTVKIVTWNIQMLPDNYDIVSPSLRKMQTDRAPWIIEYCKEQDFDIIVFQEVFDGEIKRMLRKQLRDEYPYQVNTRTKALRFASNGILIVSRIPLKYVDHVIYTRGVHSDAMAAKGCTLIEAEKKGRRFQVAGTHLQAGGSEQASVVRHRQYRSIRELLDRNKDERIPVFVVGDMNTCKTDEETFSEMVQLIGVTDYPLNDSLPYTIDGNNSWNPNSGRSQLDYIFLQAHNTTTRIINQYILRPWRQHKGRKIDLADHYGVVAEIELGSEE